MKFRVLIIGLGLLVIFSQTAFAKTFPDVSPSHKNYDAIAGLSDENIVKGYPNGLFRAEGTINRAEAVKVLVGARFDEAAIANSLNWHFKARHRYAIFPDVGLAEWFSPYVEMSYQNKIARGYPDGTFKPGNSINFAEALKMILEAYKAPVNGVPFANSTLLYVKKGDWFEKYFSYAHAHNLISRDKFYHPGQLITRGEFVEIMYRLKTIQEKNQIAYSTRKRPSSSEYTVTIPKLNIINMNVSFADLYNEKGAMNLLKDGLGHYLAPPGSGKKMVLFGHSSGYSWDHSNYKTVLRQIDKLQNGDRIYINYHEKGYAYEIFKSAIIPASQDYKLVENQNQNELALYTCWPPNSISKRYVVYGKPVS